MDAKKNNDFGYQTFQNKLKPKNLNEDKFFFQK
jgi:hypothetical protein